MRVDHDHRAGAGVMRLAQHLRRRVMREQRMIKRKHVLVGVVVGDCFLAEAFIKHERVAACVTH